MHGAWYWYACHASHHHHVFIIMFIMFIMFIIDHHHVHHSLFIHCSFIVDCRSLINVDHLLCEHE
nr:MAG TPA: Lipoprotein-releasing system transmembrane protein [Caudoviricetes sp.]